MKSLPIGYSKDLQEDKEAVFEAEDTLRGSIDAAATVVAGLTLNRQVTARRRPGCCSPPTSPTTWSPRACRSAMRTRSSGRWSGGWCRSTDRSTR